LSILTNLSESEIKARLHENKPQYRVRAELFFEIDGLLVNSAVLGATLKFRRSDCDVEIRLPSEDSPAFQNKELEGKSLFEKDSLILNGTAFSAVHMLSVTLNTLSPADLVDSRVESVTEAVVSEFID
jgi:hypothetical protein